MKKIMMAIMLVGIVAISADAFAVALGGKVIYNKMLDDYSNAQFKNNLSGGVFVDVGTFFFKSRFRPGFDWVTLETNAGEVMTVYAVHIDWYWFLLKGRVAPFLGFGPALNYRNFEDNQTLDDDSDAGIEGFAGLEFNITGPLSLFAEIRFVIHDIADMGNRILKPSLGLVYYF